MPDKLLEALRPGPYLDASMGEARHGWCEQRKEARYRDSRYPWRDERLGEGNTASCQACQAAPHTSVRMATAEVRLPTPPHAIDNQGPLVLHYSPAHLQQQLIVGVLTHGALQACHLTPRWVSASSINI